MIQLFQVSVILFIIYNTKYAAVAIGIIRCLVSGVKLYWMVVTKLFVGLAKSNQKRSPGSVEGDFHSEALRRW